MNSQNVTPHQQEVLLRLSHYPSLSIKEVASLLSVSSAAATKAIQRLERKKLVSCTQDEWDRRLVRVKLTTKGQQIVTYKG